MGLAGAAVARCHLPAGGGGGPVIVVADQDQGRRVEDAGAAPAGWIERHGRLEGGTGPAACGAQASYAGHPALPWLATVRQTALHRQQRTESAHGEAQHGDVVWLHERLRGEVAERGMGVDRLGARAGKAAAMVLVAEAVERQGSIPQTHETPCGEHVMRAEAGAAVQDHNRREWAAAGGAGQVAIQWRGRRCGGSGRAVGGDLDQFVGVRGPDGQEEAEQGKQEEGWGGGPAEAAPPPGAWGGRHVPSCALRSARGRQSFIQHAGTSSSRHRRA